MNILYFGSDVFLTTFASLAEGPHRVLALYTYHEESEYIREEGVSALAKAHNIPVHYDRITKEALQELFESGQADLVISAEYDRKIPIPESTRFRGVNIHNSLLPEGRGYLPIEMRLFQGYDYGGVTLHKLAERIDCGDILLQRRFDILPEDNDRSLYRRCRELGRQMVTEFLTDPELYWGRAQKQPEGGSYWKLPHPENYTVTVSMTAREIRHIYRSFGRFTRVACREQLWAVENLLCRPVGTAIPALEGSIFLSAADCIVEFVPQAEKSKSL